MTINVFEDTMIDRQAYGPDDDMPDGDDMPDVAAERMAAHLDAVDAAEDWTPGGDGDFAHAPSYDEWNAIRQHTGKAPGTFTDYLTDITPAINPIVAMLARRWAGERNGAGELPADWIEAEPPF